MTQKEIDLSKVVLVLKEHKKQIGISTGITTLLAILYCIFATPIYTAKTIINPPKLTDAGSGVSQLLGGMAGLSLGGGGFLSQKTDADVVIAMLNTNQLKDMVINKFNLIKYYKKKDIELTRKSLNDRVKFIPDMKSGFVEIDVDDKDPKLAANMANYYNIALGQLISNVAYNKSKQKMDFFNQQLASAKKAVNDAQSKLKDFAQKNGIVAGQQSQVIAGLTTQLQAQLVVAQAQLQAMSLYATTDNPDYKEVSAKVDAIRKQLNDISGQQTQSSNNPDSLPIPAGLAPELAQQYANLVRDVVLSDEILKVIAKQYEAAKIDALSEMAPTAIQIIDPAQVPLHKSKPQRLKIVLLCSIITLIICCVYVLIKNFKRIVIDV
jgi:uncharacterized protein involved in exopolysaccharide biosynthesis